MAKKVRLDIVTPDKVAYSADVSMVIARATDGDLGVLPGHAPLIAAIQIWPLRIITEGAELLVSLGGGFIEVQPDKITILAGSSELPEEIDVNRAEQAKRRAEERLADRSAQIDVTRAHAALLRAVTRLKVVHYK